MSSIEQNIGNYLAETLGESYRGHASAICEVIAQAATAPPTDTEAKIAAFMEEVNDKKEEIAKAFLASYDVEPKDIEMVIYPTAEGGTGWRIRKIEDSRGIPLPSAITDALREAERALVGADACVDPECGSDPCSALQMIRALLPPGEFVPTASCAEVRRARAEMTEKKAPAARPSLSLERAESNLQNAMYILADHKWDDREDDAVKAGKVRDLIEQFYDRWFTFHEENLTAIEGALPAPLDEMGGTLVAAVTNLANRYAIATREAENFRQRLEDQAAEPTAMAPEPARKLSDIKDGDRVTLKIGGHEMIVDEVFKGKDSESCRIIWSSGGELRRDAVLLRNLIRVDSEQDSGIDWGARAAFTEVEAVYNEFRAETEGDGVISRTLEAMPSIGKIIRRYRQDVIGMEDPRRLMLDILIRILWAGTPDEPKMDGGLPDWRNILRRLNACINGVPTPISDPLPGTPEAPPKMILESEHLRINANLKAMFDLYVKDWEELIIFCQENQTAIGGRPGMSVSESLLPIAKDYVESHWKTVRAGGGAVPFGELGTCKTCGQLPGNHEGMEHAFRGKDQAKA